MATLILNYMSFEEGAILYLKIGSKVGAKVGAKVGSKVGHNTAYYITNH